MKKTSCPECEGIAIEQAIRSPGELRRVVSVVSEEVARSVLEQEPLPPEPGVDQPVVGELFASPLPDAFALGFRCRYCGQRFTLSCETYHGSGGNWSVIASAGT